MRGYLAVVALEMVKTCDVFTISDYHLFTLIKTIVNYPQGVQNQISNYLTIRFSDSLKLNKLK